jgi:hypothetical protein
MDHEDTPSGTVLIAREMRLFNLGVGLFAAWMCGGFLICYLAHRIDGRVLAMGIALCVVTPSILGWLAGRWIRGARIRALKGRL